MFTSFRPPYMKKDSSTEPVDYRNEHGNKFFFYVDQLADALLDGVCPVDEEGFSVGAPAVNYTSESSGAALLITK